LREHFCAIPGRFCSRFLLWSTLRLPEFKALPIMGALIALGKGYFSFALA